VTGRDAGLLVFLGAIWGAVYPLTAVALRELSPPAVVVARTALSALVLIPFAAHRHVLVALRARRAAVLVAALLQATIPLVLLTVGQQHVSAGLAGILLASQPVWAVMLISVLDRRLHPRQLAGVLIGLGGVALLLLRDLDPGGTSGWGGLALLAAAIFYAAGTVHIQRVIPDVAPLGTATAAMTVSALALAPFAALAGLRIPDPATLGWLIVLGLGATGGALVLFYALIQRIGAVRANLVGYLAPGFAVAYGVILLGERLTPEAIVGLVVILAGSSIAASGRPSRDARRMSWCAGGDGGIR
jgi:drug/metabolite transporter (DMT)-like permease